jgi:predicted permease
LEAIRRIPGVTAAGATTTLPLSGRHPDGVILAEGYVMGPGESLISPRQVRVTPGYIEAMSIPLMSGRYFDDRDNETAPPAIIVDERLANRFWPGQNPIGRRMYRVAGASDLTGPDENTRWLTVVGVVRPVRLEDLTGMGTAVGAYYLPYAQTPERTFSFVVKTAVEVTGAANAVRAAIARIDPELALFDVHTMAQRRELSLSSRRTSMMLAIGFGALALFLSAIGIYGILAYHVTQRRREIGIRVALGSTQAGIMRLVLREGSLLAGVGLILGIAGAAALRKAIAGELYEVSPLDPLVIAVVVALLAAVVFAASVFPARRATHVSPVQVLNQQ